MAIIKNRICKQFIVLCEGIDTLYFLINYLNSNALHFDLRFSSDIQGFDFGGINNLTDFLSALKNLDGFENIHHLLILRDAERNTNSAIDMIQFALEKNDLPVPKQCNQWLASGNLSVSYTLMPACDENPVPGALEDLCWDILTKDDNHDIRRETENFVSHMKNEYSRISSHEHKSRLHTFFAVDDNLVSMKIGEAAKTGAFDWNHIRLAPLRKLLQSGLS